MYSTAPCNLTFSYNPLFNNDLAKFYENVFLWIIIWWKWYIYCCHLLNCCFKMICLVLFKSLRKCKRPNKGNFMLKSNSNKIIMSGGGGWGDNIILLWIRIQRNNFLFYVSFVSTIFSTYVEDFRRFLTN